MNDNTTELAAIIKQIAALTEEQTREHISISRIAVEARPVTCACPICNYELQLLVHTDTIIHAVRSLVDMSPDLDIGALLRERLATFMQPETPCPTAPTTETRQ